jgi:hypothetical protein
MTYDNRNRGVLFKNDRKDSDKHPDYKGSLNVNGQEFWLSAWIKEGQRGKFMSLSVEPKKEQSISQQATAKIKKPDQISTGHRGKLDMDDDIPFGPEFR